MRRHPCIISERRKVVVSAIARAWLHFPSSPLCASRQCRPRSLAQMFPARTARPVLAESDRSGNHSSPALGIQLRYVVPVIEITHSCACGVMNPQILLGEASCSHGSADTGHYQGYWQTLRQFSFSGLPRSHTKRYARVVLMAMPRAEVRLLLPVNQGYQAGGKQKGLMPVHGYLYHASNSLRCHAFL